jgi:hypothetical protein
MARITKRLIVLATCLAWGIASMLFFVYAPLATDANSLLMRLAELSCNCTFKISAIIESMTGSGAAALIYFFIYQIAIYLLLGWGIAVAVFPAKKAEQNIELNTDIATEQDSKNE